MYKKIAVFLFAIGCSASYAMAGNDCTLECAIRANTCSGGMPGSASSPICEMVYQHCIEQCKV
ncbi:MULTISPECIES: hypothetical protein [Janthinobacterium]|uniref:Kazal-like domain-containing protein n=1 Tax=Janthinobacterium rivuli TaxID=2751478 RepID=A0ABY8I6U5_9BURK|nr:MULTISPECIES: hypothetical protein [Janthinobacterium]MBW3510207.1 hypothetical protein [Janthinobacterium sp. NKUCC06_STL]MCA1862265.1 hypothetical protein [Janthinobacterium lividum]MDZ5633171.1 hypothetical protein [Janthinobacterium sp. GMG1]NVI80567.1 hypothetical protein [Janthinobacterium sp. BJB401]WFR80199.1 hypothetical protein P9875_03205 [Janthinobacterium rivuli]